MRIASVFDELVLFNLRLWVYQQIDECRRGTGKIIRIVIAKPRS